MATNMSTQVFLLQHVHSFDSGEEDVKTIGIYSTQEAALNAAGRLRLQKGFSEEPEGFSIDMYLLDQDSWTTGYVSIVHRPSTSQKEDSKPKK